MCIYYNDEETLTYKSQEHIFPATIGGINMLPKGYVSDQANNYFSKLELLTFTKSYISLSKDFEGPGKRGTKKAKGKHNISLMEGKTSNEKCLGYTFLGKPYTIPQICLNTKTGMVRFTRNPNDENGFEKMFKILDNFKEKYINLEKNILDESCIIIGVNDSNIFIAHNKKQKIINEQLKILFDSIKTKFYSKSNEISHIVNKEQVQIYSHIIEAPECSKVFAKIAINVLAYLKGKEYVNKSNFLEIKKWIINPEINNDLNKQFHCFPQRAYLAEKLFPQKANSCMLINTDGYFVACVCLLGYWQKIFKICRSFDDYFNYPDGYICDWVNKNEFTFREFLAL